MNRILSIHETEITIFYTLQIVIFNNSFVIFNKKGIISMALKQDLGQRIQYLRKEKKLTQEALAELVGIDQKNISKIENGNNYPAAETLTAIANALEVDIYELFVFNKIPYEQMKEEIINSLNNDKNILYLYKCLKFSK